MDGFQTGLNVPVYHPRTQINRNLVCLQVYFLCPVRWNEASNLCQRGKQFLPPNHAGQIGKPHEQSGKLGGREDSFVHFVFRHDFKAAAHSAGGADGNPRHIDGVNVTVNGARRDLKPICQLLRADPLFLKKYHNNADQSVQLKQYIDHHFITKHQYRQEIQHLNSIVEAASLKYEEATDFSMKQYEKYIMGEGPKEAIAAARPAKEQAEAELNRAIADKEAYEKQYQVFCKLLKASRKEIPLSEIIDCIEQIVVDVDRKIMVKWTE